jgi:hypothetical protein
MIGTRGGRGFGTVPDATTATTSPVGHVGDMDIDIAYKTFGKGEPILLFNGASDGS